MEYSANLTNYIDEKRAAFQAVSRKGIPRDERRPISYEKYSAQLFMLQRGNFRSENLKVVAKLSGVSYALVRKWTAEEAFKQGVQQQLTIYLDGFFNAFVKELNSLYSTEGLVTRKDGFVRKHEAQKARSVVYLLEAADNSWGWIVLEEAHKRIEKILKNCELNQNGNPEAMSPDDYRYNHERPRHHGAGFLRLLDLICHIRSRGRLEVDPGFAIRCKRELSTAIANLYWDLCVATKENAEIVQTYAEAISYLAILLTNKICQTISERGRQKGVAYEPWHLPIISTPRGMDYYTT